MPRVPLVKEQVIPNKLVLNVENVGAITSPIGQEKTEPASFMDRPLVTDCRMALSAARTLLGSDGTGSPPSVRTNSRSSVICVRTSLLR